MTANREGALPPTGKAATMPERILRQRTRNQVTIRTAGERFLPRAPAIFLQAKLSP